MSKKPVQKWTQSRQKFIGAPLNKKSLTELPDGTILVRGVFTSDNKDEVGDIITRGATERAMPKYRQWKNIRYMHLPRPVAKVQNIGAEDGLDWNEVEIRVIDPQAIFEVREGLLKALSVGIFMSFEDVEFMDDGGLIINDYTLAEISLVDHPANYDAVLKNLSPEQGIEALVSQYGMNAIAKSFEGHLQREIDMNHSELPEEIQAEKEIESEVEVTEEVEETEEVTEIEAEKSIEVEASELPEEEIVEEEKAIETDEEEFDVEEPYDPIVIMEQETEEMPEVTMEAEKAIEEELPVEEELPAEEIEVEKELPVEEIEAEEELPIEEVIETEEGEKATIADVIAMLSEIKTMLAERSVEVTEDVSAQEHDGGSAELDEMEEIEEPTVATERKSAIPSVEMPEAEEETETSKSTGSPVADALTKLFEYRAQRR